VVSNPGMAAPMLADHLPLADDLRRQRVGFRVVVPEDLLDRGLSLGALVDRGVLRHDDSLADLGDRTQVRMVGCAQKLGIACR